VSLDSCSLTGGTHGIFACRGILSPCIFRIYSLAHPPPPLLSLSPSNLTTGTGAGALVRASDCIMTGARRAGLSFYSGAHLQVTETLNSEP
jgi:hypothetical protein